MIRLHIQTISRPEMSLEEMREFFVTDFPGELIPLSGIIADPETGIISITLSQQALLSNEQRDWLHMTPFAAKYIDSFTVEKVHQDYFTMDIDVALSLAATDVNRVLDDLNNYHEEHEYNAYRYQLRNLAEITCFLGALLTTQRQEIADLHMRLEHLERQS